MKTKKRAISVVLALAGIALVLVLSTGASAQDKSDEANMVVRETSIGTLQFIVQRLYCTLACKIQPLSLPASDFALNLNRFIITRRFCRR